MLMAMLCFSNCVLLVKSIQRYPWQEVLVKPTSPLGSILRELAKFWFSDMELLFIKYLRGIFTISKFLCHVFWNLCPASIQINFSLE